MKYIFYTQGKIFVEDDISAYEYSNIRVRKCSALSQNYTSHHSKPWEGGYIHPIGNKEDKG
jgi:hypothetical protein